jgi:hypothetical protein
MMLLWSSASLLCLAWFVLDPDAGWRLAVEVMVVVATGGAGWWCWNNQATGQLSWDGSQWHWQFNEGQDAQLLLGVNVVGDLQNTMILTLCMSSGRSIGIWAESRSWPARWLDLRRAVLGPQRGRDHGPESNQPEIPRSSANVSEKSDSGGVGKLIRTVSKQS